MERLSSTTMPLLYRKLTKYQYLFVLPASVLFITMVNMLLKLQPEHVVKAPVANPRMVSIRFVLYFGQFSNLVSFKSRSFFTHKYRVTHHVDSNLQLTSNQKFHFGLARSDRPGQNGTFVLKSTGGLNQRDVSPCVT